MDNLLTFNLRVPVGVQVVSHLISENTIMEQFLLILSSSLGGCRYEKYRKEIEGFTNGSLTGLGRLELQSALALFAGKVADQILADFVPELSVLLGKVRFSLPGAGDLPAIRNMGNASTATPSEATPEPQPEPEPVEEPPTPEAETKKQLNEFASKNLASFPQFSEEKIEQITDQAAASIQGIAAKSNIPDEEIPKAAQLAFYDFTILYGELVPISISISISIHMLRNANVTDDSGSMTTEASRIPTTQETIRSLYKTAKTLNPDNSFSVRSFEGSNHDNVSSESDLSDVISGMTFNTGASVAAPLRNKILDPLSKAAADKTLNPTVVVIIT
ncbi:hypothetical protein AOCH_007488, partial [Aspergillus ochraceoroseus]